MGGWRSSAASPQQTDSGGSSLVPRESTPATPEFREELFFVKTRLRPYEDFVVVGAISDESRQHDSG